MLMEFVTAQSTGRYQTYATYVDMLSPSRDALVPQLVGFIQGTMIANGRIDYLRTIPCKDFMGIMNPQVPLEDGTIRLVFIVGMESNSLHNSQSGARRKRRFFQRW